MKAFIDISALTDAGNDGQNLMVRLARLADDGAGHDEIVRALWDGVQELNEVRASQGRREIVV